MDDTSIASPLAQTAGGGNSLQSQAFQQLLDQGDAKQSYLQKQQAAYNSELENYANLVKQSQTPEAQQAGRWGAIATAASKFAPTWGNIGPGIAAAGGAAGQYDELQQLEALKNQHELTQMRQAELRSLEAKSQSNALVKAMTPAKSNWIQYKDDAGNTHVMDKSQGPGTEQVIPASQNPQYMKLLAIGADIAIKQDEPDKQQFAIDYAVSMMKNLKPGVASTEAKQPSTVPVGQPTTEQPAIPPSSPVSLRVSPQEQQARDQAGSRIKAEETQGGGQAWPVMPPAEVGASITPGALGELSPEDSAAATRLVARINANPDTAPRDRKTLEQILSKYSTPTSANSIAAAAGRKTEAEEQAKLKTAKEMKSAEAQGTGEGKQVAEASEKKTVLENYLSEAKQTQDVVDGLLSSPGLSKATGLEGYIPGRGRILPVAGSDTAEFMANLKTLEARITALALQNARVGSTSGATGYGALDAGEREMLKNSVASMSLEQGEPALRKNLATIKRIIDRSEERARAGYVRTYGNKDEPVGEDNTDAAYNAWKAKKGAK